MKTLTCYAALSLAVLSGPVEAAGQTVQPDQADRMFPTYVYTAPPAKCIRVVDPTHPHETTGLTTDGKDLATDPTSYEPFQRMLCASIVLQDHYARRERRSQHFSSVLDAATFGAAVITAGLAGFGASAKAVLGAGLAGGAIAVGRNYKAPEPRQILYHKGEAALQCLDRTVRAADPIYYSALGPAHEQVITALSGGKELDDLEVALTLISGTSGTDPELVALRDGANQALTLIRNLRSGPADLEAGYESVAVTMNNRYQDTRGPMDFGKAVELIKQDIATAQGQKSDAKAASADIAKSATNPAAAPGVVAPDKTWKDQLNKSLAANVQNPKMASVEKVRPILLRVLSSQYDPVRNLKADINVCETIVST